MPPKPATRDEKRRMARVCELGCIACRSLLGEEIELAPAENHHLLDGGRRRGHRFTIGLCGYHHVGRIPNGMDRKTIRDRLGPALTDGTKTFKVFFGDDDSLLAFQEFLLSLGN